MNKDNENQTQIILDSIADGVFTVDSEWKITSFNRAAEKITGITKEEAMGRKCWEVFRASICEKDCSLRHTVETGQPVVNQSIFIINSRGERIPISISTALLKNKKKQVIGGAETFRDLSLVEELKKELYSRQSFHDISSAKIKKCNAFSACWKSYRKAIPRLFLWAKAERARNCSRKPFIP
jgi:PAS domain S-box-containing protein